jgi:hypothetical protein
MNWWTYDHCFVERTVQYIRNAICARFVRWLTTFFVIVTYVQLVRILRGSCCIPGAGAGEGGGGTRRAVCACLVPPCERESKSRIYNEGDEGEKQ